MSRLRIRRARPGDDEVLTALLRGLSPESSYQRFQTGLGPEPAPALVRALLPESSRGGAVLAYLGARPVGHAVWIRAGARSAAEVAVVVADDQQGRGLGTALAAAAVADLAAHGVERIEVFATTTNAAVARMVARHAPAAMIERDGPTVTYEFRAAPVRRRLRTVA